MNKVIDRLFLGNLQASQDSQLLQQNGITHILTVASGIKPFYPNLFVYKIINVADNST
jgi:dual specificity protein phosphatase 1B